MKLLVESLTLSTHAGLSIRLFFFKCCPKTWMNSCGAKSLTVKKVCLVYPIIGGDYIILKNNIY